DSAPRHRTVAPPPLRLPSYVVLPPATPLPLPDPLSLVRPRDLAPFVFPQSAPCPTVTFTRGATIYEILGFYRLASQTTRPIYSVPHNDARCRILLPSGRCNTAVVDHARGLAVKVHAMLGQRRCLWEGCPYTIPDAVVGDARLQAIIMLHVLMQHFEATPRCPLCECDVRSPPMIPFSATQKYALHLASGWCVGLARHAIAQGLPVVRP
ncbi:hypothetical protein HDZ31DRAFT_18708, partial [Schizophyllum fasciatum]